MGATPQLNSKSALPAGFADPVFGAQETFRQILEAMSRPGRIQALEGLAEAPAPLSPTAAVIALTLLDYDSPLWLDATLAECGKVSDYLRFHTGAPQVANPGEARFALVATPSAMPAFTLFDAGSDDYPDRSATVILQVGEMVEAGVELTGPGIAARQGFGFRPAPPGFWQSMQANRLLFPRGIDIVLAGPEQVAALPRSVAVAED